MTAYTDCFGLFSLALTKNEILNSSFKYYPFYYLLFILKIKFVLFLVSSESNRITIGP